MVCEFNRTPYKRKLENYSDLKHLTTLILLKKVLGKHLGRTRRYLQKYSEICTTRFKELGNLSDPGPRNCTYADIL
jgi:hypothetical protein